MKHELATKNNLQRSKVTQVILRRREFSCIGGVLSGRLQLPHTHLISDSGERVNLVLTVVKLLNKFWCQTDQNDRRFCLCSSASGFTPSLSHFVHVNFIQASKLVFPKYKIRKYQTTLDKPTWCNIGDRRSAAGRTGAIRWRRFRLIHIGSTRSTHVRTVQRVQLRGPGLTRAGAEPVTRDFLQVHVINGLLIINSYPESNQVTKKIKRKMEPRSFIWGSFGSPRTTGSGWIWIRFRLMV